ncbi:phage tail tape measure protein [Streptomyces scabiei]|uniref:phage tail tape measure protein n=1 Tax=Streptomyces scabiei TaxID=1930 RepID=UPI0029B0235F|nr:phage tail tape measure protein [Streptomyces scabiei]MDX3047553.1 phage tail tape measure protein [Streptomyces scabiei]
MSDTSLVFALSARNDTGEGMRDARETVQDESAAMAADVEQGGATAGAGFGETLKAGVAAAMVGVGVIVAAGFAEALEQSRLESKLAAQLDLTKEQSARVGGVAGDLFADAYGDSFETVNTAVGSVMSSIGGMAEASEGDLKKATAEALNFAEAFDIDVTRAAQSAGVAINAGLAEDATEAFDLMTEAASKVPAHLREGVLDAADEYGQFFKTLGFSGEEAFAVLVDGAKKGEFGIDKAGDAIKEFTILSTDMSTASQDAYKTIGLDANDMANAILAGGDTAKDATRQIIDGLLGIPDPAEQANTAIALFGTPLEDLNVKDIPDFLESLKGASGSMDDFGGAAKRAGETLRDNAGTKVEAFRRSVQQNVVDFLGDTAIPAIIDFKAGFQDVFGSIWEEAGKGGATGVDRIANFFQTLGQRLLEKAVEFAPKAVEALLGFGQTMADYAMANPEKVFKVAVIAGALVMALVALPMLVAGAIGATAFLVMAGFVSKLVTGLVDNIPQWWDSFTGWVSTKAGEAGQTFNVIGLAIGTWFGGLWTRYVSGPVGRQWDAWTGSVYALPGRAVTALSSLGSRLASSASSGWQRFKDASVTKAVNFIGWVGRLPARTAAAVGNTGSLLYSKGRDVVTGLWNGISSLGGWLWDKVGSFVSDNIVGAATSFLDIGSPSKLLADEVGHWLPPGIAEGAEDNRGVLDATMRGLVDPALAVPSVVRPTGVAPLAAAAAQVTVRIILDGPQAVTRMMREIVSDVGGGDVQKAFGT